MLVLFSAMGVDLPKADTVFALRTVLVSLAIGTGITLLATMLPARRRATRVPPSPPCARARRYRRRASPTTRSKAGLGVVLVRRGRHLAGIFGGARRTRPWACCSGSA